MMCLKWKDMREVYMTYTIHDDAYEEMQRRGEAAHISQLNCIIDYKTNMGGVDRSDDCLLSLQLLNFEVV